MASRGEPPGNVLDDRLRSLLCNSLMPGTLVKLHQRYLVLRT